MTEKLKKELEDLNNYILSKEEELKACCKDLTEKEEELNNLENLTQKEKEDLYDQLLDDINEEVEIEGVTYPYSLVFSRVDEPKYISGVKGNFYRKISDLENEKYTIENDIKEIENDILDAKQEIKKLEKVLKINKKRY